MATVINNPSNTPTERVERVDSSGGGAGLIIGVIVAIILIALLLMYGVPALRHGTTTGTNIRVPDKINVDVNGGASGSGTTTGQ